jgi:hypothetical protein
MVVDMVEWGVRNVLCVRADQIALSLCATTSLAHWPQFMSITDPELSGVAFT